MSTGDVPKYRSIYLDLRGRIIAGELGASEQLPPQHALAAQYGVTVMTLRQALAQLENDGLIRAARGRGTFVSARPFQYRLNQLSSFAQEMAQQGQALTTRVLAVGRQDRGDLEVRTRLGLPAHELAYMVERLRLIDGRPVLLQRSYLPATLGEQLQTAALERSSLYDLLRAELGIEVVRAVETLRAVNLSEADAEPLHRAPGSSALLSIRLSLAEADRPVLFDRALLPGDAAEVTAERLAERMQLTYRVL